MQVSRISGVELFQQWLINDQTIYVFGEDHQHGPKDGCKPCKKQDQCYTFLTFLESLQETRPVNLFVELSYINGNVATADMPSLAVVPKIFEKSNLTELRQKYLRCIWSFAEPPLNVTETCQLHNVETYPSDLRLEKVFEETKSTLEYTRFTKILKDLYVYLEDRCQSSKDDDMQYNEVASLLSAGNKSILQPLLSNPAQYLYDFIQEEAASSTDSVLALTYRRLLQSKRLSPKQLKTIIDIMSKYYDEAKSVTEEVPSVKTGTDVRRWLLDNVVGSPQIILSCKQLSQMMFMYMSSYGTMVTDLFIIMQCLLKHKDTNVILTGSFHSKVYSLVFRELNGSLIATSKPSQDKYCLSIE